MLKIYRALYTRCANGRNLQSLTDFRDGQKLFSTGGNMGLSHEILTLIEREIGRDVYNNGMRSYNKEVCLFFSCSGTSVLIHYRWMRQEETGSREFGIAKALIGAFDCHPIEYYSTDFFNGQDFFHGYPDAEGNLIESYKQLLTFQGAKVPPLFKPLTKEMLFSYENSYPVMSFEYAGRYIRQSNNVAERLRAAVCHLVKQFTLPENQRLGIIIKGTSEQLRYWFAAVSYAFSARAAQKIAFNIGLPPTGFSYNFSTAALVGWDIDDPDLAKAGSSAPTNLVYLQNLPPADDDEYYACIDKFDASHKTLVIEFLKRRNDDIKSYPSLYRSFLIFNQYHNDLIAFANGQKQDFDMDECIQKMTQYRSENFYIPHFHKAVLAVANKASIQCCEDIDRIIEVYSILEKIVTSDINESNDKNVAEITEAFEQAYVARLCDVFTAILSDQYTFFNKVPAKKPQEHFNYLVARRPECAYEVALQLTKDDAFDNYQFSLSLGVAVEKEYLTAVVYPRLSFVAYMMKWCQRTMSEASAGFVCRAFDVVLAAHLQGTKTPFLPLSERAAVYKNVFAPFRDKNNLINKSETFGLRAYWDCAYNPQNIDSQVYRDMLEKVFLYNWGEQLEQDKMKPIEQRLEDAGALVIKFLDEGLADHVLTSLYLENFDLQNSRSIFFYKYATKIFPAKMHPVLLGNTFRSILSKTLCSQRFTPDDANYLDKVIPMLWEIKSIDPAKWKVCCGIADNHIGKIFDMIDWEKYVANEKTALCKITDYLSGMDLPVSIQVKLYMSLNNCHTQAHNPSAVVEGYFKYQSCFQNGHSSYRAVLLRMAEIKRWGGKFYYQLYTLFSYDESFLKEILASMFIVDTKSVDGKSAFGDFCQIIINEQQDSRIKRNDGNIVNIGKAYQLLIDNVLKVTFRAPNYTKTDNGYLGVVIPLLLILQRTDPKASDACCTAMDEHIGKIFGFINWEECVLNDKLQIYAIADYLVKMSLPSAIKISLYNVLGNSSPKEKELDGLLKPYLPHGNAFLKCSLAYKTALLRMLGRKKLTGTFCLHLLEIFVSDAAFLAKILKALGTSKSINQELLFCNLCRVFMKEYRTAKAQKQKEDEQILDKIYLAIEQYYKALRPSGLRSLFADDLILKEFEKAAKSDKDLTDMKKWLETSAGKHSVDGKI